MKNNYIFFFILIFFFNPLFAENLLIQSKNISLDKDKQISIFKDEVFVKTDNNHTVESDLAEYDKKNGIVKFKNKYSY